MTSRIVKQHLTDSAIALLFEPDTAEYWIGEYDCNARHGSLEPPYVWVSGNWSSLEEAELSLLLWV